MVQKIPKHKLVDVPPQLKQIPQPVKQLYALGGDNLEELLKKPKVAIVGSRRMSSYGKQITSKLASELTKYGVVIVSGLAYGVDACAHKSMLEAGGKGIAVLGNGLDKIYPVANITLGLDLISNSGVILSEYKGGTEPFKTNFLARNRIIAGLSDAVIITEAAERSGSLNTAGHALNQGKPVLAVPGNITSPLSAGTNNLIKNGAAPITTVDDVLELLNIKQAEQSVLPIAMSKEEYAILSVMQEGESDGSKILQKSGLEARVFNQTLTMLEISGTIKPLGNNQWSIK